MTYANTLLNRYYCMAIVTYIIVLLYNIASLTISIIDHDSLTNPTHNIFIIGWYSALWAIFEIINCFILIILISSRLGDIAPVGSYRFIDKQFKIPLILSLEAEKYYWIQLSINTICISGLIIISFVPHAMNNLRDSNFMVWVFLICKYCLYFSITMIGIIFDKCLNNRIFNGNYITL